MHSILDKLRRPDVVFYRAGGRINISSRIVRLLGIHPGDSIDILTDDCEYYLYVAHRADDTGAFRATCKPVNSGNRRSMYTNSSAIANTILDACKCTVKVAVCAGAPLEVGGRTVVPLLTRLATKP